MATWGGPRRRFKEEKEDEGLFGQRRKVASGVLGDAGESGIQLVVEKEERKEVEEDQQK